MCKTLGRSAAVVALISCIAFASKVRHPAAQSQPQNDGEGHLVWTFEVAPERVGEGGPWELIKDFHVWVRVGKKKFKIKGDPKGGPPNWQHNEKGGRANWYAGSQGNAIAPGATATFRIELPENSKYSNALAFWKTTDDGNDDPRPPGSPIDEGPDTDDRAIRAPVTVSTVTGPHEAPINAMTGITIDSTEPNMGYTLLALSAAPDDTTPDALDDWAGFQAWCLAHPANPALTFENTTGTLDDEGQTDAPTVSVPNDARLVGLKFYLVVVVLDADGDHIASEPEEVTITVGS